MEMTLVDLVLVMPSRARSNTMRREVIFQIRLYISHITVRNHVSSWQSYISQEENRQSLKIKA